MYKAGWRPSESLAIRIWDMATLVDRSFADRLEQYQITPVALRVLAICLERQNSTATDIAAVAPIDPSSISRIVQRLIERELLARRRSSADRRVVFLRLTGTGRRLLEEIYAPMEDFAAEVTATMTEEEARAFTGAISGILERLQRPRTSR